MKLIEILGKHFGDRNVKPIDKHEGVFICEKKAQEKTYQIAFVDTSNNWCSSDYSKYLESVVIDKYYETEGFLQWNFYYYIITSKEVLRKNSSRKKEIENDETYTRKSVLTEEDFIDWLTSFENISEISKESISTDLYTNWVNTLREKKLFFVFNSDKYPNYKQPVEDYINGISLDDIEAIDLNESANKTEPVLHKIKKLDLLKFREYPLQRSYELGCVNLIQGANAVGKTSFFDTLELILTGELNYKATSERCNLRITDEDGKHLDYPTSPSPYKSRDITWYNSGVNRGNNLNRNFNKFNYFTSDAAFQLKQDDETKNNNLETIIADIALGREVNKLEERIVSFNDRFAAFEELYIKELSRLSENLAQKNKTIKELLKTQKDSLNYKKTLSDTLKKNFWKTSITNESNDFTAQLDNEIQNVISSLLNIQSKSISIDKLSKTSVENELKVLKLKNISRLEIKNEILTVQRERQAILQELEKIRVILPFVEEISHYFNHEQINFLIGLGKNIQEKTIELNKATEIKQLADSIQLNEILLTESFTKTVKQIEEDNNLKTDNFNKRYYETTFKIKQIEDGIEELSIIVSNIKSAGQSFIKLNPKAESCPLCNSSFLGDGLVLAIQKTRDSFTNSTALVSLKEELVLITKGREESNNHLELLKKVKQLAFTIFGTDALEKTLTEIQKACEINLKSLNSLTESLIQLNTIQSQFNNAGISEERFKLLSDRISGYFSVKINAKIEFDQHRQMLLGRQTQLSNINIELERKHTEKELELRNIFTSEIADEEQLLKRYNILQEVENNFKQIEVYMDLLPHTELITILERANSVSSVFETYKTAVIDAKQHSQAIELTKIEIEKILDEIEVIKPKQKRTKFAHEALTKILAEQSKSEFLSEYIRKNKTEIVTIFKLIHTPREFEDISFKNDKITLHTKENKERTLSEISTGQRSALALSIFLSLNKKLTKGPNLLMFDDPVAYVDDMNVLSFFDYLRELVIKTKRQVFFATANEDLAFIFRKKFEFLENELTTYKLERKSDEQ